MSVASRKSSAATALDGANDPLHMSVTRCIDSYFHNLDGAPVSGLFNLVMDEVERPLLERVMLEVDGNQTRAAAVLGLNRGTLRKKLKHHGLLNDPGEALRRAEEKDQ